MEHLGHHSSSTTSSGTGKARKLVGPDAHLNYLGGLIHACPVPAPILGLVEPALMARWLMGLPIRQSQQLLHP